jgi:hypothetical protein
MIDILDEGACRIQRQRGCMVVAERVHGGSREGAWWRQTKVQLIKIFNCLNCGESNIKTDEGANQKNSSAA